MDILHKGEFLILLFRHINIRKPVYCIGLISFKV
jgi:hypothetical protein